MSLLEKTKKLHPTAKVYQAENNLFFIKYNGLTLVVSFKELIGFKAEDDWYMVTNKTHDHNEYLRTNYNARYCYETRKELQLMLKQILDGLNV